MKASLFWSFAEQGFAKLATLIVQIVLARMLGPEVFGVMAIMLVVTTIAESIAQSGMGQALIQKGTASDADFSTGFWLSFAVAMVMYLAIWVTAPVISQFYEMPAITEYLRVLGIAILFNAVNSVQRSYLQIEMNFKSLFKISLTAVLLSGCLGIICSIFGWSVWSLVVQALSQAVFTFVLMLFYVKWRPSFVFLRSEARSLFSYGWKISVTGILGVLYTGVSELIIGKACNATDLGFYSQGRKYPQAAITVFTNAIANVLFPKFAQLKDDAEALRSSFKKALIAGNYIIIPLSALFAVIAEPLVILLLSEKWLACVPVFQLTCLANILLMFQIANLRAYMALGDSGLYLRLQVMKVTIGGLAICAAAIITRDIYITALMMCVITNLNTLFIDMIPAKRMIGYGALAQLRDQIPVFCCVLVSAFLAALLSALELTYAVSIILEIIVFLLCFVGLSWIFRIAGFQYVSDEIKSLFSKWQNRRNGQ